MNSNMRPVLIIIMLGLVGLISGCSTLPSSGPNAQQMLQASREAHARNEFVIRDLTLEAAEALAIAEAQQLPEIKPLSMLPANQPTDLVGPGDVLDIRIYEVGVALFGGMAGTLADTSVQAPTARAETFTGVVIDRNGNLKLPYIGELQVSKMVPAEIAQAIAQRMRFKSQSPQVLVKVSESATNVAYLSGSVAKPGKYVLAPGGTRVLDIVALAGGVEGQPEDFSITLTRGDWTVEQSLGLIIPGSTDDILLQPGDRIRINKRPRTFTVFGATGRVSQIAFASRQMSLAEAIAQAAGPNDATADATAVFLFRNSPDPAAPGRADRVIYRLNLMAPQGYFVAQEVSMRDKDLIYVANARSNQATKFIALVGQLIAPAVTARAITR